MFVIGPMVQKDRRISWNTWTTYTTTSCSPWKQRDGHLPFLGVCIYRRPDGSLGHMVCRKPIQTILCLMQSCTTIQQTSNLSCPL
jgi:hypothetical protein